MWFTGLWFAIDWFLRLLCLQNQQKERFLYITASGGDSKLDFFYKHFLLFPRNHEMENSYNFLILLPHVLCAREWEKKKDRSSIMSYIKEKLVSDISLARQWPHEKKCWQLYVQTYFHNSHPVHIFWEGHKIFRNLHLTFCSM